jgi:adenosylmethionine-8-amino-7-oxononanoate aminotransferase
MMRNEYDVDELNRKAREHLWMHFTRLGSYQHKEIPIIARGEGCSLWDVNGKRYLDALSGLFTVQLGHGRADLAAAAQQQASTLEYFPIWSYAHPPAIELAAKLAELAPGDLNRVFFTTGGSEAVESAWKLARQYFRVKGEGQRYKVIARETAYHGTTLGALAITGVPSLRTPFEPLTPGASHVPNTNRFRHPLGKDDAAFCDWLTQSIEDRILWEGPETVAAVYLEPVQNAGGCFVPPAGYFRRVREICDRYGVLLVSDEVICAFGRLGEMFGSQRYDYLPDMITCAKGLTSGYSPLGAVICRDHLAEPFLQDTTSFLHGITFGGHPVSCAVGHRNLELFEEEGILDHVRAHEAGFRERIEGLRDIPIVGDVRGAGYFLALELVADPETEAHFNKEQGEALLRGVLSPMLFEEGLICRTDDRGDPVVQLSPPLIAGDNEFDEIEATLRRCLAAASEHLVGTAATSRADEQEPGEQWS